MGFSPFKTFLQKERRNMEKEIKFCSCGKEMRRVPRRRAPSFPGNENRRYVCDCGASYVVSVVFSGFDKPKAAN